MPTPVRAFQVSKNKVHVGDAINKNNGSDFRQSMMQQLLSVCPDVKGSEPGTCDADKGVDIDNVWTSVGSQLKKGHLTFTVDNSKYANNSIRDTMLASTVATFAGTAANSCQVTDIFWSQSMGTGACALDKSLQRREAGFSPIGQEFEPCKDSQWPLCLFDR